jgi:tRNA(His) guanylyltransferase
MFICSPCADKNKAWGILRSWGPCEMCSTTGSCYDIPSHRLTLGEGVGVTPDSGTKRDVRVAASKRADRMKGYEDQYRVLLVPKSYSILRVDGRAFHTLTRGMQRPFDASFMNAMDQVGVALCEEIQGAQFAFVQSDEVSVLMTDFGSMQEPWFGGVIQKMASVAASVATVAFNDCIPTVSPRRLGQFDARVFMVPSRDEVINYFLFRQADCYRNAVSMAAEAHFSSKQLLNRTVTQRLSMLTQEGVSFEEDYPQGARHGRVIFPVPEESEVRYRRKDTEEEFTQMVIRMPWRAQPAPWFDWDQAGFLEAKTPRSPEVSQREE